MDHIPRLSPLAFHSAFSFGKGLLWPAEIARALKDAGHSHLPLTDDLGFYGILQAITAAEELNLTLLLAIRVPLEEGAVFLYPDDETGYTATCRVASHLHQIKAGQVPEDKPRGLFTPDQVRPLLAGLAGRGRRVGLGCDGLAALAGSSSGDWKDYWGIPADISLATANKLQPLADAENFMPLAFSQVLLGKKQDALALAILKAIQGNRFFERPATARYDLVQSPEDTASAFAWYPKALENAGDFLAQGTWTPPRGTFFMPRWKADPEEGRKHLRELAWRGAKDRFGLLTAQVLGRLESEFSVICEKDFADYFLIVHEIVLEAERQGHRVLGRGSAANSLISYAIRLTHVDPLRYGLSFERFLNPQRSSPPDIDLDFSWRIRDGIFEFLRERWGADRVALISTHVTLGGRGALREVGKTLGHPDSDLRRFSRAMSHLSIPEFWQTRHERPECQRLPLDNPDFRRLFRLAARLEGRPVHLSLHAGGVVVAPESIYRFCPTQPSSKAIPMTQLEMRAIEALGLVKIDLLAQRSLGVFADVTEILRGKGRLQELLEDPEQVTMDARVREALRNGETMGVFYIESPGMRSLLKKLGCQSFSDLTAASSVIRPGVAESGMMQEYISRHRDPAAIPRQDDLLGRTLEETHGVMIYQEDVMRVAHAVAGFSLAEADILRRAMSGKSRGSETMLSAKARFLAGAHGKGMDPIQAEDIWRQMESFSGYAFCKAHSASYAVLSLQLLWMKKHVPGIFMAAVLNNRGGFYGPFAYVSEARRLGQTVLPPDIMESGWDCLGDAGCIRLGFSFILGLAEETGRRIIREREREPFQSIFDLLVRVKPGEREWENLLDSGALRGFGPPAQCRWEKRLSMSGSLFQHQDRKFPRGAMRKLKPEEWAFLELKSMHLALSAHPTELFSHPEGVVTAANLAQLAGRKARLVGFMITAKSVTTKKGQRMKFVTFEDQTGLFEVTFFPSVWRKIGHELGQGGCFLIEGRVDLDYSVLSLIGSHLARLSPRKDLAHLGGAL